MSFPDFNKFALEIPLYEEFPLEKLKQSVDVNALFNYIEPLKNPDKPIDIFCVDCQKESTFRQSDKFIIIKNRAGFENTGADEIFMVELSCTREPNHKLYFIFRIKNLCISKIGQHYSIADINIDSIKKYRKILGDEKYKELSKAVGLVTHGVGIGSFVYLRRIFENLIYEAYENIKVSIDIKEFQTKRMDEKIDLLKPYLPEFLVNNKSLYSILSVGIHSLSENDCLKYFDVVKVGIELILDEKIELLAKKEKAEAAIKSLGIIKGQIKS
jgi:hypothetical protein